MSGSNSYRGIATFIDVRRHRLNATFGGGAAPPPTRQSALIGVGLYMVPQAARLAEVALG